MNELINKATQLLNDKSIDVFIGYGKGSAGRIRAILPETLNRRKN